MRGSPAKSEIPPIAQLFEGVGNVRPLVPDEIGRTIEGDPARQAPRVLGVVPAMKDEKRQAAVEMQAASVSDLSALRAARIGQGIRMGVQLHHQRFNKSAANAAVCEMNLRIASSSAWSGLRASRRR